MLGLKLDQQSRTERLIIVGLSVFAILISSFVAYYGSVRENAEERFSDAFSSYLSALKVQPGGTEEEKGLLEAKFRLVVYGDNEVIKKLAEFQRCGANLKDFECAQSWVSTVVAMRKQVGRGRGNYPQLECDLTDILVRPGIFNRGR